MNWNTLLIIVVIVLMACCIGPMLFMRRRNKKGSAMNPAQNKSATTYTCPMHPEVQSDQPGKCPKCGMQLVPKK